MIWFLLKELSSRLSSRMLVVIFSLPVTGDDARPNSASGIKSATTLIIHMNTFGDYFLDYYIHHLDLNVLCCPTNISKLKDIQLTEGMISIFVICLYM